MSTRPAPCKELKNLFTVRARLAAAQASKAEAEAAYERITLAKRMREENDTLSSDYYNHVYRFTSSVDEETVAACISVLSKWSRQSPKCNITLILQSPGGDVISGAALFDFLEDLKRKGHHLTTKSMGYAASMAAVLLQAGTVRVAAKQSWILLHEASMGAIGKLADVEDRVEWIRRICDRFLDIFSERASQATGKDKARVKAYIKKNWSRKDFWLASDEALKLGIVDVVQ
jgi:ATP-dependent Clp endopeptidase proteolytic subunit ClpP